MRQEEGSGKGFGWDLLKRVLRDPQSLQGGQPTLLKYELLSFLNDRFCGVLRVGKAFIISFIFASLQSLL